MSINMGERAWNGISCKGLITTREEQENTQISWRPFHFIASFPAYLPIWKASHKSYVFKYRNETNMIIEQMLCNQYKESLHTFSHGINAARHSSNHHTAFTLHLNKEIAWKNYKQQQNQMLCCVRMPCQALWGIAKESTKIHIWVLQHVHVSSTAWFDAARMCKCIILIFKYLLILWEIASELYLSLEMFYKPNEVRG